MKKICVSALCLALLLCLTACGGDPATSDPADVSTPTVSNAPNGGTDGGDGQENSSVLDDTDAGNVVDGGLFFGDDTTTTTTTTATTTGKDNGNGGTTTTQKGDAPTTTTTQKPTTTTTQKPTTTVAPPQQEEIEDVTLPKAGYDPDGRGRIVVEKSEVKIVDKKQYAYITFANVSKKVSGKAWIVPEYTKVTYACYDKNGAEVKGSNADFGVMYLGSLEDGEKITCDFEIPAGTVEIRITGHNFEYWTPWS